MSVPSRKAAGLLKEVVKSNWLPTYHEAEIDHILEECAHACSDNYKSCADKYIALRRDGKQKGDKA